MRSERDRVRRSLITGNHAQDSDALGFDAVKDALVTVIRSGVIDSEEIGHFGHMPPLASISAKLPSQQTIADEFTLNREQRTGKSQPIRARSKYFLVTKRVRKMRNPRPIRVGDLKVEKEWYLVECLLIDQMCMVSPNLLAKHVDPQVPFGGVNVTSFGNYMQYGTMCELPLLTDFTKPSRNKSTKLPNENCGCTISESA